MELFNIVCEFVRKYSPFMVVKMDILDKISLIFRLLPDKKYETYLYKLNAIIDKYYWPCTQLLMKYMASIKEG